MAITKDKLEKLFKNNEPKLNIRESVEIYGYKEPKIVLQEGRNFMVVKEGRKIKSFNDYKNDKDKKEKDNLKDTGLIFQKNSDTIKLEVKDNITDVLYNQRILGGSNINYYDKYIKYKTKYIQLKNKLS